MPTASLADVGRSAAAAVGVPGFVDTLGIGPSRHVIVCLIDGLGWKQLIEHPSRAPAMSELVGSPLEAVFPTTTAAGLGSFGTGLLPGAHGLVGASFLVPEFDTVLNPLRWGGVPTPIAVQPEPTVFEAVARAGVHMTTVAPEAYRASGLTRAALRGAEYRAAEDVPQRVRAVLAAIGSRERSFTYVYWPHLDRIGHGFGTDSSEWRTGLALADTLVERLVAVLPAHTSLVVTSDHGMVDCPAEERILLDDHPALMHGVLRVAGEPRARHVYVHEGAGADVQAAWQHQLGESFVVLRRSELIERDYFGPVDAGLADRIGDVMAIATGRTMLASRADRTVSGLIGQHGALTPDEVLVPGLIHRGA